MSSADSGRAIDERREREGAGAGQEDRRGEGAGELAGYAKMHFKTAYEAQGLEPPKKPAWSKFK